jgi:hypothetical protein
MKTITQEMDLEKETKGTYRFKDPDESSVCPVIYVKKAGFTKKPSTLTLILEIDE